MKRGAAGFSGARLREARDVRGLTAVALAEIAGVSPQAISQYETGRSSPTPRTLGVIAAAVNLPEAFFLRPPRDRPTTTVFYRSMSSATKSARARAERRFEWLRDIVSYLSEFVEFPQPNFPHLDLPADPLLLSDGDVESAAEDVRKHWSLPGGPIANMVLLLENQGAVVARDILGAETLDGLSGLIEDEQRPYILIGTDKGGCARWRFDAAHELGHMILHSSVEARLLARPEHFRKIEEQAHRFASAFLLPINSFGDELFAPNLDAFQALKLKWKVSVAMMIIRARNAGFVSEETERKLWINYSRRGWRRDEPFDDVLKAEEPRVLRRSIELLLDSRMQTPEDLVSSLSLAPADIEALTALPRGYLSRDFAPVMLRSGLREATSQPSSNRGPAKVIPLQPRPRTDAS